MFEIFNLLFFQDLFLFLFFLITIIYYVFASYQDFKQKEVFNFTNFSYLFIILFLIGIYSLARNSLEVLFVGLIGILIAFVVGSLLFFMGIWGGGDAKFLIPFGGAFTILSIYTHVMYSSAKPLISYLELESLNFFLLLNQIIIILSYVVIICLILAMTYIFYIFLKTLHTYYDKNIFDLKILVISTTYMFLFLFLALLSLLIYFTKEVRLLLFLLCIFFLFILPTSTFFKFSSIQKLSVQNILKVIEEDPQREFYLLKDNSIELLNKRSNNNSNNTSSQNIISKLCNYLYFSPESISIDFLKNQDNNKKLTIVELLPILPFFLVYVLISLILVIFTFKQLSLQIAVHFLEFILLSFLVGGIYVLFLVIFNCIRYYKLIISSIPKYRLYTYLLLVILFPLTYIFLSSFNNYSHPLFVQFLLLCNVIIFSIILYEITKIIEKKIFVKSTPIINITLGDWIVEDVKVKGKVLFEKEVFKLGVDESQLKVLNELYNEKKITTLKVKSGIAFVPHLFFAFILLILFNIIF